MNAPHRLADPLLDVCRRPEPQSLQAENAWLEGELKRLAISRGFWRRFTLALIAVWATLVGVSFLAGPTPSPCLRGRLQPAYSPSIPLGVRGAPWPVNA